MGWFSSKVKVTLVDHASWKVLDRIKIPPDQLPETFAIDTQLHLGDVSWQVVEATPVTRTEFSRTKALTIRVKKIEMIDPWKIRLTLPTIFEPLAPVGNNPLSGNELKFHEDLWRQFEFVSRSLAREVDEELTKIKAVLANELEGGGFDDLHLRTRPLRPIDSLSKNELTDILEISNPSRGVTYSEAESQIESGFAFELAAGFWMYGIAPDGNISVLALHHYSDDDIGQPLKDRFKKLMESKNLDLIHWCSARRLKF